MDHLEYFRDFPRVVRIEPAASCNLRCSHCPTGTVELERGIMKADVFDRVIEEIERHFDKVKVVVLYHGGEPLLNKAFPEMIRRVKAIGIPFVKTVSNGMLLTQRAIADLLESGLDSIEFSIDGESPAEHNFVRRRSDCDTIVANIKRLIDTKMALGLNTPRVQITSAHFLTAEELQNKDRQKDPSPADFMVREFSGKYADQIGFNGVFAMRWPHMAVIDELYEVQIDPHETEDGNECDHVLNVVSIRWNGDVVPCCHDITSQHVLGNVLESSLSDIWNNEKYRRLRKSIDTMQFIGICGNCNAVRPSAYLIMKPAVRAMFDTLPVNMTTASPSTTPSDSQQMIPLTIVAKY